MAAATIGGAVGEQVDGSSIVTMMCRNGTSYGVRLAGSDALFLAAAPPVSDAMYYPDYGPETSAPDIGDSAILELVGLGGAAAADPAVAGFLGGSMSDAVAVTEEMQTICTGRKLPIQAAHLEQRGDAAGGRRAIRGGADHAQGHYRHPAQPGVGQTGAGSGAARVLGPPYSRWPRARRRVRRGGTDRGRPLGAV